MNIIRQEPVWAMIDGCYPFSTFSYLRPVIRGDCTLIDAERNNVPRAVLELTNEY